MGESMPPWALITGILAMCSLAASAFACWNVVSRCTRIEKWTREQLLIPPSDKNVIALREEVTLWSSLSEKLATNVQRLNSRVAMRAIREKDSAPEEPAVPTAPPPLPESATKEEKQAHKLALRRFYGLNVQHTEFVRRARTIETEGNSHGK